MYKIRKALSKTESWSKIREKTVKRSRGLTDNRGIQMNQAQKTLLALLKHALREERYEDAPEQDWNAVLDEANIQAVTALAASALPASLTEEDGKPWKKAQYTQLGAYTRYMYAQDELCRLFAENAIPMLILKGSAAGIYYARPGLRAMGDIDLIVPRELFPQAKELMLRSGYMMKRDDNGRHIEYEKNRLEYELHHTYSHRDENIESYVTEGLRNCVTAEVDGHMIPMLPRLSNGIVLLDHLRHHLREGVGLRQLIDWMMYVDRELDDEFWRESFCAAARQEHMEILAKAAARLCQRHLGLRDTIGWCADVSDELCDFLLENVLSSGNFGQKNKGSVRVESTAASIRNAGLLRYLQKGGEIHWGALKKYPWLRPLAWAYQLYRYAGLFLNKQYRSDFAGKLDKGNKKYRMLKELDLFKEKDAGGKK